MTAPKLVFRNVQTNKQYEIVRLDRTTNIVTLRGDVAEFDEPYDKARFEQMGYVLERVAA